MQASDLRPAPWAADLLARHWRRVLLGLGGTAAVSAALMNVFAAAPFVPEGGLTGWVGRPALSSNNLTSGNEKIYRAEYRRTGWTGRVTAHAIDANGTISTTSAWSAGDTAEQLDKLHWDTGRKIITLSSGAGVAFRWNSLSNTQKSELGNDEKLLKYVRGDRSEEEPNGAKFRLRARVQGPIQHSTLLHWQHSNGSKRLYVGGNDGMLHAFNADTGAEVFAYVPSMLLPKLPLLKASPYAPTKFVDGGLAMADVAQSDGTNATLLAGALGGGGKGLFMLDVTSPSPSTEAAAASFVKWEVTPSSTGFGNLGYTYAAPRLARLNTGTAAVVVGNGYANTGNGHATLLLINAATGSLIREIDTGSGSTGSPNGLSTATLLDENRDGRVDYAYAGDIDGNLWRFDLRGDDPSAYSVSKLMTTDGSRPITSAPVVTPHPVSGYLVAFGTGRILTSADLTDTTEQYAYGVWDGAPTANTSWLQQTVTAVTVNGKRMRTLSANKPDWSSTKHRGWRLTLPAGERVVGEGPMLNDGRLYLTTSNPTVAAPSTTSLAAPAGETWLTEVDIRTGGSPAAPIYDVNGDGKINSSDNSSGNVISGVFVGNGVMSQAVLADKATFSTTLFNRQADYDDTAPPAEGEDVVVIGTGVSGGHFDADVFGPKSGGGGKGGGGKGGGKGGGGGGAEYGKIEHKHRYDNAFNVTGINYLNASMPVYNLGQYVGTETFKVLVMNQYLSPGVQLAVGSTNFQSVKEYGGQASAPTAQALLDAAPKYTINGNNPIGTLIAKMPVDGFTPKDWWKDGGELRSGLIPTQTSCVSEINEDGTSKQRGKDGERNNGAFTIQIIKSDTPASALEKNRLDGDLKYGWRVIESLVPTYVLAEYTLFWHTGPCYHLSSWRPNPPPQMADNDTGQDDKEDGSADPTDNGVGSGEVPTIIKVEVTVNNTTTTTTGTNGTTTVITYSDNKTHTTKIEDNGDGTETVTVTDRAGNQTITNRVASGVVKGAPDEVLRASGRLNWREIFRQ